MISSFEDLKVWQSSRKLNKRIYTLTQSFPKSETFSLVDQLRRASVSICANIAEGFGRYHTQESIQFYRTARGSLLEIKSHLHLALDQLYLKEKQLEEVFLEMDEIGKMLNGLIASTRTYRKTKL